MNLLEGPVQAGARRKFPGSGLRENAEEAGGSIWEREKTGKDAWWNCFTAIPG